MRSRTRNVWWWLMRNIPASPIKAPRAVIGASSSPPPMQKHLAQPSPSQQQWRLLQFRQVFSMYFETGDDHPPSPGHPAGPHGLLTLAFRSHIRGCSCAYCPLRAAKGRATAPAGGAGVDGDGVASMCRGRPTGPTGLELHIWRWGSSTCVHAHQQAVFGCRLQRLLPTSRSLPHGTTIVQRPQSVKSGLQHTRGKRGKGEGGLMHAVVVSLTLQPPITNSCAYEQLRAYWQQLETRPMRGQGRCCCPQLSRTLQVSRTVPGVTVP